MTERRAQEARIREQNERLEEFASVVSHDLRTPLAVASGWVELARGDEDPNESLDRVGAALDRMGELVTGVLELARSGAVDPEPDVPLAAVARAAWSESTATTGATLEAPTDLGTVTADPDRLHELLCNLFRNAVEHGTGGDGAEDADDSSGPTVRVGRLDDDGFYVEDDGPGIPAEDRETVFDRGFTTGGSGTGLGLYIVSRIAAAHGWTVEAVEGKTGGARFEVRFCRR